jgi:hypothetical protein
MSVLGATLLVLAGLAIMGFGIFLFYAWLPFLYGLFGLEIGLLLGRWLTGGIGLVAIIFGIVSAVILFCAAYFLEPYRRILLGLSAGAMVGRGGLRIGSLPRWCNRRPGGGWCCNRRNHRAEVLRRIRHCFICIRRCRNGFGRRALAFPGRGAVRPCRRRLAAGLGVVRFERDRDRLAIQEHRRVGSTPTPLRRHLRYVSEEPEPALTNMQPRYCLFCV